ncbi:ABC transporter permease [Trebonia kvetii]|uniref:ABC transporter permease n=1 Tax=Trebonia kvetii TaxID=2480626 RepID=A0A6P2C7G6_9ACTN|nr:ABC transporter permease [Trebonia kvetii]TVZ05473.1 ABC transporter permease [Trebonia kvetii]
MISFGPGAAKQTGLATLERRWASFCASIQQSTCLVTSQRPNTVNNYAAIDGTPAVLAGVLAVLGLGVLAQFTVASARSRRRDYAVLKVLGLRRAQLRAVALGQASAVTVAALVIGIPFGAVAGRWAWQAFASQALVVEAWIVAPRHPDHGGRQVRAARLKTACREERLEPPGPAPDVRDFDAGPGVEDQVAEHPEHRPVHGRPLKIAGQPFRVELGEHIVRGPQLIGLVVHRSSMAQRLPARGVSRHRRRITDYDGLSLTRAGPCHSMS